MCEIDGLEKLLCESPHEATGNLTSWTMRSKSRKAFSHRSKQQTDMTSVGTLVLERVHKSGDECGARVTGSAT